MIGKVVSALVLLSATACVQNETPSWMDPATMMPYSSNQTDTTLNELRDAGQTYSDGTYADPATIQQRRNSYKDQCSGLCGVQRLSAARALDRNYNTNAGVNGWFPLR